MLEKISEPLNVTKEQSYMMLVLYDVSTTQCEIGTIKCDVLITWYNRLPTSGYYTPKKRGSIVELPFSWSSNNTF